MNTNKNLAAIVMALCIALLAGNSLAADDGNLLKPTNKKENWRLEQHEQGKGEMTVEGDAIVFTVTNTDGEEWHVQAFQFSIELKDGKEYVVTFKAKADAPREMKVQAGMDEEDWHLVGLDETVEVGKDLKEYKYTFTANDVNTKAKKNRVGFVLGGAKGKVWVQELAVKAK